MAKYKSREQRDKEYQALQDVFSRIANVADFLPEGWRYRQSWNTIFSLDGPHPFYLKGQIYKKVIRLQTAEWAWKGPDITLSVPATASAQQLAEVIKTQFIPQMTAFHESATKQEEVVAKAKKGILDQLTAIPGIRGSDGQFSSYFPDLLFAKDVAVKGELTRDGSYIRGLEVEMGKPLTNIALKVLESVKDMQVLTTIKLVFGAMEVDTAEKIIRTALSKEEKEKV